MQNDKNFKHLHRAGVYYLQLNMRKNRVFSNAKMRHAQNQLTKDTAVVPLYNMTESHLARKNLRGVLWHPVGEVDYTRSYFD
ncbi:hypothetical protein [Lactobacillus amylovorus]|uniref:hypothetical protein n=1 Tax=Lactobacillus amylovorus TaxID=1604 RepID=UPI00201E43AE|nr:hypothetical protein [Lactobacillus amylovorus]